MKNGIDVSVETEVARHNAALRLLSIKHGCDVFKVYLGDEKWNGDIFGVSEQYRRVSSALEKDKAILFDYCFESILGIPQNLVTQASE